MVRQAYLDAEITTVNVVAEEKIAGLRRVASHFKKLHEIKVLSVNVATDGDGSVHFQQIGL